MNLTIKYENIINCYYVSVSKFRRTVIANNCFFCDDVFRILSRDIQME